MQLAHLGVAKPTRRPIWRAVLRFSGYWLLALFLCLEVWISADDHLQYLEDPQTYQQVYRDPWLEQAVSRIFGFFSAIAMVFHMKGWRDAQFSRIAVACLLMQIAFLVADHFFNIIVLCCT